MCGHRQRAPARGTSGKSVAVSEEHAPHGQPQYGSIPVQRRSPTAIWNPLRTSPDGGDPRVGAGAVLLRNAANAADGSQTERWQLRETKDGSTWLSTLTVHGPAHAADNATAWFWVEVEGPIRASVPRLARELLAAVPAYDSLASLTGEPVVISRERVDEIIDVLCDPERRYPAVVASPHPEISFGEWKDAIRHATWYLPGLASIYLLDPLAQHAFE